MGKNKELAIALAEYAEQVKKLHEALAEVREYIFSEPYEDEEESFADGYDEGCGHDQEQDGGAYDQAMREEYGDED